MRTEEQAQEHEQRLVGDILHGCAKCATKSATSGDCECHQHFRYQCAAYEACIPKDFWYTKPSDVTHNVETFGKIRKYVHKIPTAHRKGYGLVLCGNNGVGKTMFISYVLGMAIRRGRTCYYTTLLQLEHDIKKGFDDPKVKFRLDWLLGSDFLAIDELGKEQWKDGGNSFIRTQVERILKQRFDDQQPTLIGTNFSRGAVSEAYGPTITSMLKGKYKIMQLEDGDMRVKLAAKMDKEMEW